MSAIISEKFRIFNAQQFLESLTEGPSDTSTERTRMYFFVGRSDAWYGILEYYSGNATALAVGNEIYDAGASGACLLYTSPSPRDRTRSRMPSSA